MNERLAQPLRPIRQNRAPYATPGQYERRCARCGTSFLTTDGGASERGPWLSWRVGTAQRNAPRPPRLFSPLTVRLTLRDEGDPMQLLDTDRILNPIILSSGSHDAGTGRGCAMNVVSYVNGDTKITDYPACSDRALARIVQRVNDSLAGPDGLLSPENAVIALELGFATVGTSGHGLSDLNLQRVYVRLAVHAARKVAHLNTDPRVMAAIEAAEAWAADPSDENKKAAREARTAADAAAAATDAATDAAAVYASAAVADAADAASAVADAADAASAAATDAAADAAAAAGFSLVDLARELIDMFKALTGIHAPKPEPAVVDSALTRMYATA